jgi:hypothetical protein
MSLAEIYPERHKPFIDTGVVRVIESPLKITAFVRNAGVMGVGYGKTKDEALKSAWHDAGKFDGVQK